MWLVVLICLVILIAIILRPKSAKIGGEELPSVPISRGILSRLPELEQVLSGVSTINFADEIQSKLDLPQVSPMTNYTYVHPELSQFCAIMQFAARIGRETMLCLCDTTLPAKVAARLLAIPIVLLSPKYVDSYAQILPIGENLTPGVYIVEELPDKLRGCPFISTSHDLPSALDWFNEVQPRKFSMRRPIAAEILNWPEGRHRIIPYSSREGEIYTEDGDIHPIPQRGEMAYYNYILRPYGWHEIPSGMPNGVDHCGDCAQFSKIISPFLDKFSWVMNELSAELWDISRHGNYVKKYAPKFIVDSQDYILVDDISKKIEQSLKMNPLTRTPYSMTTFSNSMDVIHSLALSENVKYYLSTHVVIAMLYGHRSYLFDQLLKHSICRGDFSLAETLSIIIGGLLNKWSENPHQNSKITLHKIPKHMKFLGLSQEEYAIHRGFVVNPTTNHSYSKTGIVCYKMPHLEKLANTHGKKIELWSYTASITADSKDIVSRKYFLFDRLPERNEGEKTYVLILRYLPAFLIFSIIRHFIRIAPSSVFFTSSRLMEKFSFMPMKLEFIDENGGIHSEEMVFIKGDYT